MASQMLTTFYPRRWRVFVLMFVACVAGLSGALAVKYALRPWPVWDGPLPFAFTYAVVLAGIRAWRAPNIYAVSVSDTKILGWPALRRSSTIPLVDLDRVRSAKRRPIDRILGQQRLFSTGGERIYLWRAVFAGSDLRRLLDLLKLGQPGREAQAPVTEHD